MDVKVSKDIHNSRWFDRENIICVRQNSINKLLIMMKKVINRGKRSKTLREVKPVENANKRLQNFLEVSPVQKAVFPSRKLEDHAYE